MRSVMMPCLWRRRGGVLLGTFLLAGLGGCGKKAPLRLPEDRPVETAPAVRARVREGRVNLDFRIPRHRLFPEREEPWILVRILRQTPPSPEVVEAGAILEKGGFAFDSPLTWSDRELPARTVYVYRVEFRDGARRRALSEPLKVSWDAVPAAPAPTAAGRGRAVILTWPAPAAAVEGLRYRIYRRVPPGAEWEALSAEPVAETRFVDSMIEPARGYCYALRAVVVKPGLEIEGPVGAEACATAEEEELPPESPPAATP